MLPLLELWTVGLDEVRLDTVHTAPASVWGCGHLPPLAGAVTAHELRESSPPEQLKDSGATGPRPSPKLESATPAM